jgi:hypothetical protein
MIRRHSSTVKATWPTDIPMKNAAVWKVASGKPAKNDGKSPCYIAG